VSVIDVVQVFFYFLFLSLTLAFYISSVTPKDTVQSCHAVTVLQCDSAVTQWNRPSFQ